MVMNDVGSILVFKRTSDEPLFSGQIHGENSSFPVGVWLCLFFLSTCTKSDLHILHIYTYICFFSPLHCSRTPTTMMNEPKLHSIRAKVRRCRNNGNWPRQRCADPQHSSRQFSLISINSFPIHHTPQET